MKSRDEFLKDDWVQYPQADSDWVDVTEACELGVKAGQKIAGRLSFELQGKQFSLHSDGSRIELQVDSRVGWLSPQSESKFADELSFEEFQALFKTGDLVVVEIERAPVVDKVLLLAPSLSGALTASSITQASRFDVHKQRSWAEFLEEIRGFFRSRKFIEATTPTLVPSPGTEPFLDPFETKWVLGSRTQTMYLPTSPEFHLKQLLVRGATKIFEIKSCFRNGEIGSHHQPEFQMLEWYRAFSTLESIADDVEGLLDHLGRAFEVKIPALKRTTMTDLFSQGFPGFKLTPTTSKEDLAELAAANSVPFSSDDSFDDLFFRLFLEKIEHGLGQEGPLLVSHYPPSQAALSRIGSSGFAERFEVYWKGLELANAFHELNDPRENEERFRVDAEKKRLLGKSAVPRDENLVAALQHGMPPSGGIALGVDRLFMALLGIEKIEDARAFPVSTD